MDGCATFWKRSKFQLAFDYSIELNECAMNSMNNMKMTESEGRKYLQRTCKDNVAQILILESIMSRVIVNAAQQANHNRNNIVPPKSIQECPSASSSHICVVNTHIYSNQNFPDVKLWQSWMIMQEVEHYCNLFEVHQANLSAQSMGIHQELGVVLCGDFNSEPTSAVYDLLKHGRLEYAYPELDLTHDNIKHPSEIPYSSLPTHHPHQPVNPAISKREKVRILPDMSHITHAFKLTSAMDMAYGHEPTFTNYTATYKGTLDYMFYSSNVIKVLSVNELPSERDINEVDVSLPNVRYPSDHLMLCMDASLAVNIHPAHMAHAGSNTNISALLGISNVNNSRYASKRTVPNVSMSIPKRVPLNSSKNNPIIHQP